MASRVTARRKPCASGPRSTGDRQDVAGADPGTLRASAGLAVRADPDELFDVVAPESDGFGLFDPGQDRDVVELVNGVLEA